MNSGREQEVGCVQARLPDPCRHALTSLFGNLELYRPLRLLLHDRRAASDVLAVTNVAHPQLRQITCPKLAVDGEIEHCQIPHAGRKLQAHAYRPNLLKLQRRLLAGQSPFIPGYPRRARVGWCAHDDLRSIEGRSSLSPSNGRYPTHCCHSGHQVGNGRFPIPNGHPSAPRFDMFACRLMN